MRYDYDYGYSYGVSDSVFAALMSIYLIIFMVALIFWIVEYVFYGIGLYTIAKRMGKNYPWLAFIPFARKYLHGELAGTIELKTRKIKNPGIWKLVLPIIAGVVFSVFMIIFMLVLGIGTFMGLSAYGYGISGGVILFAVLLVLILAAAAVLYEAVYKVLCVLINIQIYERFTTHNMGIAHAVLSAVVPLYEAFCLFVMRNKEFNPGMEPKIAPTPAPMPPVYPTVPVQPAAEQQEPPVQPAASDVSSEEAWKPAADADETPEQPASAAPETENSVSTEYRYADSAASAGDSESSAPTVNPGTEDESAQPETAAPDQESAAQSAPDQEKNDNMF